MQENNSTAAGTHIDGGNAQAHIQQQNFRLGLPSDQTFCRFPMLLPGARCYTDASIAPDMPNPSPRRAGLGIFILDPRRNFKFYIKVQIGNITSVIMAEAAALAFSATASSSLQIGDISFLTDSQLLVSFFNGTDLSSPPHWEAKPFTQSFLNSVINKRVQVLKVQRSMNVTAHSLANQAFRHSGAQCSSPNVTCTNATHESFPLRMALLCVPWEPFSFIAATCC